MPDLIQVIAKDCLRLLDSGSLNISDYENDYKLPKKTFKGKKDGKQ